MSDLPERWHYTRWPYVLPLTAVADPGFFVVTARGITRGHRGNHGYDNAHPDMLGIFLAMGPAFKPGQKVERLRNVDLYQIMCRILRLPPYPNNGSRLDVMPLLSDVNSDVMPLLSDAMPSLSHASTAVSVVASLPWVVVSSVVVFFAFNLLI
ncbi:hypothetical protein ACOMHN_039407 [Nucella lapillus]